MVNWNFEGIEVESDGTKLPPNGLVIKTKSYTYQKTAENWDDVSKLVSVEPNTIMLLRMGSMLYMSCMDTYASTVRQHHRPSSVPQNAPRVINHTNLHTQEQVPVDGFMAPQRLRDPRLS